MVKFHSIGLDKNRLNADISYDGVKYQFSFKLVRLDNTFELVARAKLRIDGRDKAAKVTKSLKDFDGLWIAINKLFVYANSGATNRYIDDIRVEAKNVFGIDILQ